MRLSDQPSAVQCLHLRATDVLVGREQSPGTTASSDTADPTATTSLPGLSQTWMEWGESSLVFFVAAVVALLGHQRIDAFFAC